LPSPGDDPHLIRTSHRVSSRQVLGGLHDEYFLESVAA
jgi:hypothetical protein